MILLIGLPLYIVAAVSIVALFDRPPIVVEFLVWVLLGIGLSAVQTPAPQRRGSTRPGQSASPFSSQHE